MKLKSKKFLCVLLLVGCILLGYFFWLSLRPVHIIAVHQRSSNFSDVLVSNFPLTDRGKINWWLKNKNRLKENYMAPNLGADGSFDVTFWLFGDGYKEEGKYDRLCFDDMKTKVNCIEKDAVFSVSKSKNLGILFTVHDGTYRMHENGEISKFKYESGSS